MIEKNFMFSNKVASIPAASSKDLAAFVVLYRALGMGREFSILCMEELCKRRNTGDEFKYEEYIEEELTKIPKVMTTDTSNLIKTINEYAVNFTRDMKK